MNRDARLSTDDDDSPFEFDPDFEAPKPEEISPCR